MTDIPPDDLLEALRLSIERARRDRSVGSGSSVLPDDPVLSPPCVGYGGDCDEPTVDGTAYCRGCLEASCDPNDTVDPDAAHDVRVSRQLTDERGAA